MLISNFIKINGVNEAAKITTNGNNIFINIFGKNYTGKSFSDLSNIENKNEPLTNYEAELIIPLLIKINNSNQSKELKIIVQITPDSESYKFSLHIDDKIYSSENESFEYGLIFLQNQLPVDYKLICCLSCNSSSYNPYGNASFGTLFCLNNIKDEYKKVKDKFMLLQLIETYSNKINIPLVQETFNCKKYEEIQKTDWIYSEWKAK